MKSDPKSPERSKPGSEVGQPAQPTAGAVPPSGAAPPAAPKLTPEEQMALFEKDLKENDWGHQPC